MKYCQQCGKELTDKQEKFCSVPCACRYRNVHLSKKVIRLHCEQCDAEFETDNDSRRFCSMKCAYQNRHKKIPDKSCVICGKIFSVDREHADKNTCSVICRGKLISRRRKGVPLLTKRTLPDEIEKHCIVCGRSFTIDPHHSIRNTCSDECRSRLMQKTKREPIEKKCPVCGQSFFTHNTRKGHITCSRKCRGILIGQGIKEFRVKIPHPLKGTGNGKKRGNRYVNYGPDWIEIAENVRHRDNHTCQVCGFYRKGNTDIKALDVHHITPLKEFQGNYYAANRPENLVTLCESCHVKVESGTIPLNFEHIVKSICN